MQHASDISRSLSAWLESQGMTQSVLAEKLGTTKPTISRILKGQQWPSRELMQRIAVLTNGEVSLAGMAFQSGQDAA